MDLQSYYTSAAHSDYFGAPRENGRKHNGDDFSHSTQPGTVPVPALLGGEVVSVLEPADWHGFGHQVTIESEYYGSTYLFSYSHGAWPSPYGVGATVKAGEHVLVEGTSGSTFGSCAHVELRVDGVLTDPWPVIKALVGTDGGSGQNPNYSDSVAREQNWLISRGYDLGPTGADGIAGPMYEQAVRDYQTYLASRGWYTDAIDGKWGANTQAAHEIFYAEVNAPAPAPEPWNPFGIAYCAGLQKIANLYGANTAIDQTWGPRSAAGFAQFLRENWGYVGNNELGPVMWASIAQWLRSRWGYVGNDEPGPIMREALQRAETANFNEL